VNLPRAYDVLKDFVTTAPSARATERGSAG
jgi:hypothetical protein